MANSTSNMHLTKPTSTEPADIEVINANMETLDGHRHGGGTDGQAVKALYAGQKSSRLGPGLAGRVYVATDDGPSLSIDNGTTWAEFLPALTMVEVATTPYTVQVWNCHVAVNALGGPITVVLPTAVENRARLIEVRKIDSSTNTVTVDGAGLETINGAATIILYSQYDAVSLRSDGTNVGVV